MGTDERITADEEERMEKNEGDIDRWNWQVKEGLIIIIKYLKKWRYSLYKSKEANTTQFHREGHSYQSDNIHDYINDCILKIIKRITTIDSTRTLTFCV